MTWIVEKCELSKGGLWFRKGPKRPKMCKKSGLKVVSKWSCVSILLEKIEVIIHPYTQCLNQEVFIEAQKSCDAEKINLELIETLKRDENSQEKCVSYSIVLH